TVRLTFRSLPLLIRPPTPPLFPYTTLFRSWAADRPGDETTLFLEAEVLPVVVKLCREFNARQKIGHQTMHTSSNDTELIKRRNRSEEHTSELQSRFDLVCRLLLEKKNRQQE